jgi:3'(2'), 5'-bisphosphate nucleotidase
MNEAIPQRIDGDAAAALIEPLTGLVIRAGAAILTVNRSAMKVDGKIDGSPVTEADLAADRIIADGLAWPRTYRHCPRSAFNWRSCLVKTASS